MVKMEVGCFRFRVTRVFACLCDYMDIGALVPSQSMMKVLSCRERERERERWM